VLFFDAFKILKISVVRLILVTLVKVIIFCHHRHYVIINNPVSLSLLRIFLLK
jgi:hypothetical protein